MNTPSFTALRESPLTAEVPRRANTPVSESASEVSDYRHVRFRLVGEKRVRPGKIQTLPARRFTIEDDNA